MEWEFLNEKLQQIREAQKAFNELVVAYGKQEQKFQVGDIVKLRRNGRKYTVTSALYGYKSLSSDFELSVEYMIEPMAKGSKCRERASECDLEPMQ